jgi:hypothetical protein
MKTYIKSGFAAALIASAAFAGSAMAQSTQYQPYAESPQSLDDTNVDRSTTGSIYPNTRMGSMSNTGIDNSQDRGDYYEGAQRPTN